MVRAMTRAHTLSADIGSDGITVALACPYDTESEADLQDWPQWLRPVCRPGGAPGCQARSALAERGPGAVWGGPRAPLGDLPVHIWTDDTGYRIAASPGQLAGPEDTARELAGASRSPRYRGERWHKLLESVSDVDYAWREAVRLDAHRATVDALRARLVDWHTRPPR